MDEALGARLWDTEYRKGRYAEEPPLPFVEEILATVRGEPALSHGMGFYVGCGNGRNYLPLVCGDFRGFHSPRPFHYLVALQVFQHGTMADVAEYFANVRTLLRPGGLLFLRVNAVSTQIHHPHAVIERNDVGGVTVRYQAGPKQGLPVHFFSRDELLSLTREAFDRVMAPREDVIARARPQTGFWAQWEGVWRLRAAAAPAMRPKTAPETSPAPLG